MRSFCAPFLVLAATAACSSSSSCDLRDELKHRAGKGATDCGHVELGASPDSVDDCVMSAFQGHAAFFARYDRQGTDSKVVAGISGDADGEVTLLTWDGDPSGGSGADPVISGDECIGPSVDSSPTRDPSSTFPILCASGRSLGRVCE